MEIIEKVKDEGLQAIQNCTDSKELNQLKVTYLGKKGPVQALMAQMKDLSNDYGYAKEVKEYKQNPENYKGHVGDISTVIRVTLTGRCQTPDLYEIMQVIRKRRNFEKNIEESNGI